MRNFNKPAIKEKSNSSEIELNKIYTYMAYYTSMIEKSYQDAINKQINTNNSLPRKKPEQLKDLRKRKIVLHMS